MLLEAAAAGGGPHSGAGCWPLRLVIDTARARRAASLAAHDDRAARAPERPSRSAALARTPLARVAKGGAAAAAKRVKQALVAGAISGACKRRHRDVTSAPPRRRAPGVHKIHYVRLLAMPRGASAAGAAALRGAVEAAVDAAADVVPRAPALAPEPQVRARQPSSRRASAQIRPPRPASALLSVLACEAFARERPRRSCGRTSCCAADSD